MHFTTVITTIVLALATGASAWAQTKNGEWIANNNYHKSKEFDSGHIKFTYHEACSYHGSPGSYFIGPACRYWVDGKGKLAQGCMLFPSWTLLFDTNESCGVVCKRVAEDIIDCQPVFRGRRGDTS